MADAFQEARERRGLMQEVVAARREIKSLRAALDSHHESMQDLASCEVCGRMLVEADPRDAA